METFQVDLDEELISHLAIPESLLVIRNEKISPKLIEDELTAEIFDWQLNHIREHGKPATPSVIEEEFELDLEDPLTSIGDLLERLRDRYVRNNAREVMEGLASAYKDDPALISGYMVKAGRELQALTQKRGEQLGTGDLNLALEAYDREVLKGPGPSLGFDEVDQHFHGQRGLTTLLAPPGTYKSWFAINSLIRNVKEGRICHLYSLELPATETDMRIRCMVADIPWWKYVKGQISPEDRKILAEASELLDSLGTYQVIKPDFGERGIVEMTERSRDSGADVIYFDQLQYVETSEGKSLGSYNKTEKYWEVLDKARDMSDDGALFFVHQFNRQVMFAESMPDMQYAKGSSAIEETATLVLGLWANKDMRKSNIVELGTLKTRNFAFNAWELKVNLSYGCGFDLLGEATDE